MNTKTTVISQEQLQQQFDFCQKINAIWHSRGIAPKAYVETYGCQQNEADSERIRGMLSDCGYAMTDKAEGDFFNNNIWALTQMYYRLWLYYHRAGNNTQFFPRLFELLRKNPMERSYGSGSEMRPVTTDGKTTMEEVGFQLTNGYRSYLHFYKLCCEAAQEDLTEFFRAHGYFTVMEDRFVGDYSISVYNLSQQMIDEAHEEERKKKARNAEICAKIEAQILL